MMYRASSGIFGSMGRPSHSNVRLEREEVRLAVDEGNPQSLAFWTKNGFTLTGEVHPNDFSAYLPMERSI